MAMTDAHDVIDELRGIGVAAVARGLVAGSGGNLSARISGTSRFVVTRTGSWLDRLTSEDFSTVDAGSGEVVDGPDPSSEYRVHLRVYQARSDVGSVVHLHQQMTVLVDAAGLEIAPLTLDQAHYLRRIGRVGFHHNGSWDLGDAVGEAAVDSNAIVLAHHGAVTLGDGPDMAYRRALNLEEAAVATYRAAALGRPHVRFPLDIDLPDESAGA
jgi:ribulose-5-phosphate 4-epimerase/fuculose-1-phosphate aldolase